MSLWKLWGAAAVTAAVAFGAVSVTARTSSADQPTIMVYKTPTCGCCGKWIEHMKAAGFRVTVRDKPDLTGIKRRYAIPVPLMSCHTAVIEGYAVEGHVPADVIQRLLRERPHVVGIAVPGMPGGSPGMEGPVREAYTVVTFDRAGGTTIYATR